MSWLPSLTVSIHAPHTTPLLFLYPLQPPPSARRSRSSSSAWRRSWWVEPAFSILALPRSLPFFFLSPSQASQLTAAQEAKNAHTAALAAASAELRQAREQAARDAAAAAAAEAELREKLGAANASAESLHAQLNEKVAEALELGAKLEEAGKANVSGRR